MSTPYYVPYKNEKEKNQKLQELVEQLSSLRLRSDKIHLSDEAVKILKEMDKICNTQKSTSTVTP